MENLELSSIYFLIFTSSINYFLLICLVLKGIYSIDSLSNFYIFTLFFMILLLKSTDFILPFFT